MIRRLLIGLLAVAVVAAGVLLATRDDSASKYEFDAVFDTARGMVPGQLVKIAGARVGKVEDVSLTKDRKASFRLRIDEEFGPLRQDAECKILPEGFISESFVQCDPGTPAKPELATAEGHDGRPTVPVERTEVSVQLQQVIDTFSLPVDQRIRLILTELGVASGGRAKDLNATLRRANPALTQANEVLKLIGQQRQALRGAVTQTDSVLALLADRDDDVRKFVDRAADVAETTASKSTDLERSVQALPPMLAQVRSSLDSLDTVGDKLTPTAAALRESVPQLTRANGVLRSLAREGSPALTSLGTAAKATRPAITPTRPVVRQLNDFSQKIAEPTALASRLLLNLRETGGIEALYNMFYTLSITSSLYDGVSHLVPIILGVSTRCFINRSDTGCGHQYTEPKKGQTPINDPNYQGSLMVEQDSNAPVKNDGTKPVDSVLSRSTSKAGNVGSAPQPKVTVDKLPAPTQQGLRELLERWGK